MLSTASLLPKSQENTFSLFTTTNSTNFASCSSEFQQLLECFQDPKACYCSSSHKRHISHYLSTVQAIRNITNFSCKKITRIRRNSISCLNSCTKFAKNSSTNSCLKITFSRKRYGEKYQYHQYYLRSSSVEFYLHGQTLRYVDIIKGISYSKLFNKRCVGTQAFRNINFIDQGFSFLF